MADEIDADATHPLVLLPVRLETRFVPGRGGGTALRVRIYPDEVHLDELDRGLTPQEVEAGQAWWRAAWVDPVPQDAFGVLVAAVGARRAEWVAHATTPTNLAARGSGGEPQFPAVPSPAGKGALARGLPDRFVVVAVQGREVSRAVGLPVPADLALSPVPLDGEAPVAAEQGLLVPPGAQWLVDYPAAEAVGMAVTVPLAAGAARVDRLVVVGTRAGSPEAGATALEDLLTGHRFGDGLGLLPQGSPTNNADAERSPFSPRRAPAAPPLAPAAAQAGSDADALARTLGVDSALVAGLVGPGTGEQQLAHDVNTALWAPGWGEYLARLDEQDVPGVSPAQRESARLLFGAHVRGRGPAPAVHVGAQPYGVLPVSDLRRWDPAPGETTQGVHALVVRLLERWALAVPRVPTVRPGAAGIDETLLEVLGSSPVMQYLRVRPVVSDDVADAVEAATGVAPELYLWESSLTAAIAATVVGPQAAKKLKLGSLHSDTRPLNLPLSSDRDDEFLTALLGSPSRVLEVDSVLQALAVLAWRSDELDVARAAPATVLPDLVLHARLADDLQARAVDLVGRAAQADAAELHAFASELAALSPQGVRLSQFQPVPALQTSLAEVALSAPESAATASLAAAALGAWVAAMGIRSQVRTAMAGLVGTDTAARGLAVAEALDLTSHRLDAWATAVVADRRERQAGAAPRGLTLGAYGVVENLTPRTGTDKDGWIHAPSTQHAVTAGMLRSAHLSHLPDDAGGGPFAIDLSSVRLQDAVHVIEGVRAGQQLAALVGYQIERALADARLARLQLSLRTIAPLRARRLTDDDGDEAAAKESVAATNVVDGLLLLQLHPPGVDESLRRLLDTPPANPYVSPGSWQPLTDAEWASVTQALRDAAETVDAVADVMLAESVLQYAGGNPHRAAAAMDAVSTGASLADSLDVLEAHDSGQRLSHALLVVVGPDAAASTWQTARPRAQAEPTLERWASARLGPPAQVVVASVGGTDVTLETAGLCALDVVFATDAAALERALRAALPIGDVPLRVDRDPAWPSGRRSLGETLAVAASLRALVSGSRGLLPTDLVLGSSPAQRDLAAALPELCGRAQTLVQALAAAVATTGPALAGVPEDGIVADEASAAVVRDAVVGALDAFGVPLVPVPDRPLDLSWARAAAAEAGARAERSAAGVAAMQAALEKASAAGATPAAATEVLDAVAQVASAVLGPGFVLVPVLAAPAGEDDLVRAVTEPAFPAPAPSAVRRFVQDQQTVRPQVRRYSEVLLLAAALGNASTPTVAQLVTPGPDGPPPGADVWLAGPLRPEGPWPAGPVGHLVLDVLGSVAAGATVAGLAVDAWAEDLPAQPGPKADPGDPRPGRARTGLALRADAASARPPQAILAAISPDGARWDSQRVVDVVAQVVDLARVRMVTLERLAGEARVLPALYTQHHALQGEPPLSWLKLAALDSSFVVAPFVKDLQP